MKILYSHRTKSADGQYVHIRALTDALRAAGHDLKIVAPEGVTNRALRALDADQAVAEKAKHDWRLPQPLYEVAEFGYSVPAYWRMRNTYQQFLPDILYERYNLFYHAGAWLKQRAGVPMIMEVNAPLREERARHGGLTFKNLARYSEQSLWNSADIVLPVTEVLSKKIIAAGVCDKKIHVIHNGVDDVFLKSPNLGDLRERLGLVGKLVLGFTGFVREWHGVDRILTFMAKASREDLHFLLVGDGPAIGVLKALAEKYGLQDQMTITGIVQREEVPAYVALFDIALQPAVVAYASPLKLFEYMAMEKPILAPAMDNIKEILTDSMDALLFAKDKEETFIQALHALCEDSHLRQRLGSAARQTLVQRDYTWSGNAKRVEVLAERLLGQQGVEGGKGKQHGH